MVMAEMAELMRKHGAELGRRHGQHEREAE